jgi:hypothetical protein
LEPYWPALAGQAIEGTPSVSIGTIILIILVITLLGGFSGIGGGGFMEQAIMAVVALGLS